MPHIFQDYHYSLRRTVDPTSWPISLAEAKRALDLGDTTTEDTEINELIPVAVEMVEEDTQRSICNQTWQLTMDYFPDVIELRRPPVTAVSSVQYIDEDSVTQTFAASNYDVDTTSAPGRIILSDSSVGWPTINDEPNAVIVTFTAGYGSDVPRIAWQACMIALKSLYYGCPVGEAYHSIINRLRWEGGAI